MNSSIEETNFSVHIFGEPDADTLLIQMVDDHDMEVIEKEVAYIRELSGGQSFCLKAIKVVACSAGVWRGGVRRWRGEDTSIFDGEDSSGCERDCARVFRGGFTCSNKIRCAHKNLPRRIFARRAVCALGGLPHRPVCRCRCGLTVCLVSRI